MTDGWIGVEDRLPDNGQVVLIWPRDEEHPVALYEAWDGGAEFSVVCCGQQAGDVTHWRPMPPPPRTPEQEKARLQRIEDDKCPRCGQAGFSCYCDGGSLDDEEEG